MIEDLGEVQMTRRQTNLSELTNSWWTKYYQEVFFNLLPFRRYRDTLRHRNLAVGDICFLKYKGKIRADYRLCRVSEVVKDEDDIVRTVTVTMRSRLGREKPAEYRKKKPPQTMETGVQRLCLLMPNEEFEQLPVETEDGPAKVLIDNV